MGDPIPKKCKMSYWKSYEFFKESIGKGCSYICQGQYWQGYNYIWEESKCADLSEILCCLVGGWDISVRFTLMSGGDLT